MLTLGTHNTGDHRGHPTPFADIIGFTEAIPRKVRRELKKTHRVYVCGFQRSLVIAISRDIDVKRVVKHYRLVHGGRAKVTPHRGEFWLTLLMDDVDSAVQVGHWINAAFEPYVRGEADFRSAMWERHQRIALRIIERHIARGREVYHAGDLNTPRGVSGYDGVLNERGTHYDRIGSTRPLGPGKVLSRLGSDHWRIKAKVG